MMWKRFGSAMEEFGFKFCVSFILLIAKFDSTNAAVCNDSKYFGVDDVELANYNQKDTVTGRGFIPLDSSYIVNCCGVLDTWEIKADTPDGSSPAAISFQIWRPTTTTDVYELVGETNTNVSTSGKVSLNVTGADQITVKPGDKIGWWMSGRSLVYYRNIGSVSMVAMSMGDPGVGDQTDWSTAAGTNSKNLYAIRMDVNANTAPFFTNTVWNTTLTNLTIGTIVDTISVSDPDVDDVNSLDVTMTAHSLFAFNTSTKIITVSSCILTSTTEVLDFTVTDACQNTATTSYNVTVVVPNTAPFFTNTVWNTTLTNLTIGTIVDTISVSDPDVDDVSSLDVTMTAHSLFAFNTSTKIITVNSSILTSTTEVLELTVTDACQNTATTSYTVTVVVATTTTSTTSSTPTTTTTTPTTATTSPTTTTITTPTTTTTTTAAAATTTTTTPPITTTQTTTATTPTTTTTTSTTTSTPTTTTTITTPITTTTTTMTTITSTPTTTATSPTTTTSTTPTTTTTPPTTTTSTTPTSSTTTTTTTTTTKTSTTTTTPLITSTTPTTITTTPTTTDTITTTTTITTTNTLTPTLPVATTQASTSDGSSFFDKKLHIVLMASAAGIGVLGGAACCCIRFLAACRNKDRCNHRHNRKVKPSRSNLRGQQSYSVSNTRYSQTHGIDNNIDKDMRSLAFVC